MSKENKENKEIEVNEEHVEHEHHDPHFGTFLLVFLLLGVFGCIYIMINMNDNRIVDKDKTTTTTTSSTSSTTSTTTTKKDDKSTTTVKPTATSNLVKEKYENTYNLANGKKVKVINLVMNKTGVSTPELQIELDGKEIYRYETDMVVISKNDVYSINDTDFVIGIIDESDPNSKNYLLFYGKDSKYKSMKDYIELPVLNSLKYENNKFIVKSDRGKIELDMECQEAEEDRWYEVTEELSYKGDGKIVNEGASERKSLLDLVKEEGADSCHDYLI